MHVVVAGGSGFLGRPLRSALRADGHRVTQLVRRPATLSHGYQPDQLTWDPASGVDLPADTDAVINMCGAGIADKRWSAAYKQLIRSSRVIPTTALANAVARQGVPVLLNGSGVGYYGDTGDRLVDENAPAGTDFLAGVSIDWEGATAPAAEAGARVVLLRTGLPLHRTGGFLGPQLLPFKLGVGGRIGDGKQWVPWISRTDWIASTLFLLSNPDIHGPVNQVAPSPVTNAEFTKALGAALHRPTLIPVPRLALKLLYGEFSNEAYRGLRVAPSVLMRHGFAYRHTSLKEALRAALKETD